MWQYHPPYNPFNPVGKAPTSDPAPEISDGQRKAARDAGATHIGRDGLTCYSQRGSVLKWAYWKEKERKFSTWLPCGEMAEGAIKLDG
jgi:hypothetical protein